MNNITVGNEEYKLGELVDDYEIDQDKINARFGSFHIPDTAWHKDLSKDLDEMNAALEENTVKPRSNKTLLTVVGLACTASITLAFGWVGLIVGTFVLAFGIQKVLEV